MPTYSTEEISTTLDSSINSYLAGTVTSTVNPYMATTTTYTPAYISVSSSGFVSEEDIKKYTEKTDKHVDELEEDIQFLNEERGLHLEWISALMKRVDTLEKRVADLECNLRAEIATIQINEEALK